MSQRQSMLLAMALVLVLRVLGLAGPAMVAVVEAAIPVQVSVERPEGQQPGHQIVHPSVPGGRSVGSIVGQHRQGILPCVFRPLVLPDHPPDRPHHP